MAVNTEGRPYGVCLIVAYDGTDFAGSQRQLELRTVQSELERAGAEMTGHPTRMRLSGRTDAGVHALAQVVGFDSARAIHAYGFFQGLNRHLPDDIRVQRVALCDPGYEPRFDALAKTYRYLVSHSKTQNPLQRTRAYQVNPRWSIDVDKMRAAARMLEGTHDFRAFRQADDARENTMRTFHSIAVEAYPDGDALLTSITVRGTAFMKNMVRILAGTLIDVGRGRLRLEDVPAMVGPNAQRIQTGHTAPAHGLTLMSVELGRKGAPSPFSAGGDLVYPPLSL